MPSLLVKASRVVHERSRASKRSEVGAAPEAMSFAHVFVGHCVTEHGLRCERNEQAELSTARRSVHSTPAGFECAGSRFDQPVNGALRAAIHSRRKTDSARPGHEGDRMPALSDSDPKKWVMAGHTRVKHQILTREGLRQRDRFGNRAAETRGLRSSAIQHRMGCGQRLL